MLDGLSEKLIGTLLAIPIAGVTYVEMRLRGKVNKDAFKLVVQQQTRLESHIWDIMKAQNIKPTMDVPEEIKNNNND